MKKFIKFGQLASLITLILFTVSCDETLEDLNPIVEGDTYAAELSLTEGQSGQSATVFISDLASGSTEFEVLVTFTSTGTKMRRLYMTENLLGAGDEPFQLDIAGLDKKSDGSLDIESNQGSEFSFVLPFPVNASISQGTVVYNIWATSGRGDYRDDTKRFVAGVGTITVNYGGTNPATTVNSYSAKILAAPLADGSSSTFISLLDGTLYKINQGEEYVAFWDFGYYYGGTGKASLSSAFDYPSSIVDIETVAATTSAELNHAYFALSLTTSTEFDAITNSNGLNGITASSVETINGLVTGDIVEFVDNYGKKGLIRVSNVVGTFNSTDYIEIDIKVQP